MQLKFNQFQSLSARVTLFTLMIFLISLWTLVLYASKVLRADMRQLLSDQQLSSISMIAADINQKLDLRLQALQQVAEHINPTLLNDHVVLQAYLQDRAVLSSLFNDGVFILAHDGTVIADTALAEERLGANLMNKDEVVAALKEDKASIGRPYPGKTKPYPIIAMVVPIHDPQGKVIGAFVGQNDLAKRNFLDRISENQYGKTGGYSLVSTRHRLVITSSDHSRIMLEAPAPGVNPIVDRFMQGYGGSDILNNAHGVEVLVSVESIPLAGWIVSAQLPTKEAFAPINELQARMLGAATLLTLIVTALTWWLLRRQLNPLLIAAQALHQRSTTNIQLQPLAVTSHNEIGVLIDGFNQVLSALAQREEALNSSEQRYRVLVEWSPEAIIVHRNGHLLYVNPAAVALFEAKSASDLLNRHLLDLVDPSQHSAVRARIKKVTEEQDAFPLFEQQCITLKGAAIDLEIQVTTAKYDGEPATQSVLRNITQRKLTERALRESEARFRHIMESGMVGMIFWNAAGEIVHANDAFLDMLGYSRADLQYGRMNWREMTPPEFTHLDTNALAELTIKGTCTSFEKAYYHKNGTQVAVQLGAAVFAEQPGNGVAFVLDISQRKVTEEKLRMSEENLAITLHSIGDAVIATDASGLIVRMNATAEQLTGWTFKNAEGQSLTRVFNIIDAKTRLPLNNPVQLVMERNEIIGLANHTTLISRHGQEYQISDSAAPIRDAKGNIVGVVLVFSDVTEDYEVRESLERSTQLLERTGELAQIGGWELNLGTMNLLFSRQAYRILGYDENVVFSLEQAINIIAPGQKDLVENAMQACIEKGIPFDLQLPAITATGHHIWLHSYAIAIYEDGNPIAVRGVLQNITESRLAAEKLRVSEENLAITLNSIGDGVIATDSNGLITRMNPTAERLTGWSFADAEGIHLQKVFNIINAYTRLPLNSPIQRVMAAGNTIDLAQNTTLIARNGQEYQIFDSAAPIRDASNTIVGVVLVFSDVTAKYRTEEALKRSEASMVAAQARAHFGNWDLDLTTMTGSWSAENFRLYGLEPAATAPTMEAFFELIHPDDRTLVESINASIPRQIEPITFEFRTNPAIGPERVISSTLEVIRDYNCKPVSLVGTSLDVTERKQSELALQATLKEKEALLREVHHRVKNNLQVINSLLRLEIGRTQLPVVKDVLTDMQGRVRSMALLHESLYRSGTFAAVDLGVYLKQLATQAFRTLNVQSNNIQLQLDMTSIHVEMDQALPCGLLVNELISNCLKHGFTETNQGVVNVSLKAIGNQAQLQVSDTGSGLPADFDLKQHSSLGLQLVSDLAAQLGGNLTVDIPALFTVTFPVLNH